MKYDLPNSQSEILPNLPGLKTIEEIGLSEFEGFLRAEIELTEKLSKRTKFNAAYILKIHKLALGHLYSFAGKYRDVNISKAGFPFAAARFLPESMKSFEDEIRLNCRINIQIKTSSLKILQRFMESFCLSIHSGKEMEGQQGF